MKRLLASVLALSALAFTGRSAEFFSTAPCEELFTIGVRAGINTSNRTINPGSAISSYQFQSWGTGFTAGAVASINIRDYISIEPGVFFESRSGHSSFTSVSRLEGDELNFVTQSAHRHTYNLNIPVLASMRFNLSDRLRWHVDFGPYVAFKLKSKFENKELYASDSFMSENYQFQGEVAPVDFGFKMGTALELSRRLYFGIHYEAGAVKAYKDRYWGEGLKMVYGGRTKAWNFTLGWNF